MQEGAVLEIMIDPPAWLAQTLQRSRHLQTRIVEHVSRVMQMEGIRLA